MIADDSAPIRKYLSAASFDFVSCLRHPASTKVGMVIVSSATNSDTRSRADEMAIIPSTEVSNKT